MSELSILLFGSSGAGKTQQLGELAKVIHKRTEGAKKLRLYVADHGSAGELSPIQPEINVGIIEVVNLRDTNPWIYEWAVEGKLPPLAGAKDSRWVIDPARNAKIGGWAFEGFTSMSKAMLQDLSERAAKGEKIGQDAPIKIVGNSVLTKTTGADGIIIGSNSMAHYGVVQNRLQALAYRSFQLPGIVCWTALDQRGQDKEEMISVIGPDLGGKALTAVAPQWFNWTFHLVQVPADGNTKPEHRLYVRHHKDMTSPGATALGNIRLPQGAAFTDNVIVPASLKTVFEKVEGEIKRATDALAKELGITSPQ